MKRGQWIAIFVIVVAAVGLVATNLGAGDDAEVVAQPAAEQPAADQPPTKAAGTAPRSETPPFFGQAGDLVELDGWLQSDATAFSDFDGTVRVVQFWTLSCINCKRTIPNLSALYAEFEPQGLEMIGVHSPEFDFEKDPVTIQQAAIDLNVTWPIALDTEKKNFRSWQEGRRFWPRTFVLDQNGEIRFDRIGEGAYEDLNATVAYLIQNGP